MCPVNCPENYMKCPGGMYGNGCVMPDNCIPMAGNNQKMAEIYFPLL